MTYLESVYLQRLTDLKAHYSNQYLVDYSIDYTNKTLVTKFIDNRGTLKFELDFDSLGPYSVVEYVNDYICDVINKMEQIINKGVN
jgi:hypothetical protein